MLSNLNIYQRSYNLKYKNKIKSFYGNHIKHQTRENEPNFVLASSSKPSN